MFINQLLFWMCVYQFTYSSGVSLRISGVILWAALAPPKPPSPNTCRRQCHAARRLHYEGEASRMRADVVNYLADLASY